jgi:SpoVK/Ycf46/Vps4 family AAA+-type ATPase
MTKKTKIKNNKKKINKPNKKRKSNPFSNEITIINKEIKTLDDLINLGMEYDSGKKYNIDLFKLYKIVPTLTKLKNVIGMNSVKKSIIGQIIYFLQNLQNKNENMLHTVIQGPPGVGKTMLGHIIGQIYWELDIIQSPEQKKNNNKKIIYNDFSDNSSDNSSDDDEYYDDADDEGDDDDEDEDADEGDDIVDDKDEELEIKKPDELKFKIAKRSDLIGKYLGHTAPKTQQVIDSALGGVLFIDEAYALGNPEVKDSFAKECIDTINQNLTEKKNQLLVIIAGYEDALEQCFFAFNEGLNRRFPFRYTIESYTNEELAQIFCKMVNEIDLVNKWSINITTDKLNKFFKDNYKLFPNFGGDVETFLFSVKIQHGIRVFCLSEIEKRKINIDDMFNALKIYRVNKEIKNNQIQKYLQETMYI